MCLFVLSLTQRRTAGFCFELCHCGLGYHSDSIQVVSHTKTSQRLTDCHCIEWFFCGGSIILDVKTSTAAWGFISWMDFNIVLVKYICWEDSSDEGISLFHIRQPLNRGHGFLYWRFSLCRDYHSDTFFIRRCTKSHSSVISVYKLYW